MPEIRPSNRASLGPIGRAAMSAPSHVFTPFPGHRPLTPGQRCSVAESWREASQKRDASMPDRTASRGCHAGRLAECVRSTKGLAGLRAAGAGIRQSAFASARRRAWTSRRRTASTPRNSSCFALVQSVCRFPCQSAPALPCLRDTGAGTVPVGSFTFGPSTSRRIGSAVPG